MSETTSTSTTTSTGFWAGLWSKIQAWFKSTEEVSGAESLLLVAAGTGAAALIVQRVGESDADKLQVAEIGVSACPLLLSLCTGSAISESEVTELLDDLKADAKTQLITSTVTSLAGELVTGFTSILSSYTSKKLASAEKAFVNGLKAGFAAQATYYKL